MFVWIFAAVAVTAFLFFFAVGFLTFWRYVVDIYKDRKKLCERDKAVDHFKFL